MAALYVGLGIAMMSGISAMMQIGTNINKITIVRSFSNNYPSELASSDKKIMELLNSYSGPDSDVCISVRQNLDDSSYQPGPKFDVNGITETPSKDPIFIGSCALVNANINHRVLIKKNEELNSFSLFSCSLEDQFYCNFEESFIEDSEANK
tara:strand:- start:536 stop:991 length:456 start_codon:yes stop_codon:yes gene_type:complete